MRKPLRFRGRVHCRPQVGMFKEVLFLMTLKAQFTGEVSHIDFAVLRTGQIRHSLLHRLRLPFSHALVEKRLQHWKQLGHDGFIRHQPLPFFLVMGVTLALARAFPCKTSTSRSVGIQVDCIARRMSAGTLWIECPG